jgi:tetratricopeptide (TPR) repeat protein
MFELKKLSQDAVPAALKKAERYRLLNEPLEAESICLDILETDPQNQEALIALLLARTDQFDQQLNPAFTDAMDVLQNLDSGYHKAFYEGVICERRAKAHLKADVPGAGNLAYEWFRKAMKSYEKAIEIRPPAQDDPILRWNVCARTLMRNPELLEAAKEVPEQMPEW